MGRKRKRNLLQSKKNLSSSLRKPQINQRRITMPDVKLNSGSDDVGRKFKIIGISVTFGLNAIVFIWYFFFSGLTWNLSLINYLFIDVEGWFENVVKEITIYESFDGTRFDSLNDAENYEEGLKNQAIRSLCNHDYDAWEDYMFTRSREPDWKLNLITTPLNSRITHAVTISNKNIKEGLFAPLSISFRNPAKVAILLFRDGEWSKKFAEPYPFCLKVLFSFEL